MHVDARVLLQPFRDIGMLVGRIVVGHNLNRDILWRNVPDLLEEGKPLLVRVGLVMRMKYLSGRVFKRREQCRRPVPDVVVGLRPDVPNAKRQPILLL